MGEWCDIETAPKDGAMFLIYVPTAKSRIISTSRGGQFWCQEDWAKRGGYTICDDHGRPVKATHWQPLPAPPGTTRAPADLRSALEAVRAEVINSPETVDFMAGVPLEAAHQRDRWGVAHDAGKGPLDWFWLIGYLAQKAATAEIAGDLEKAKHHTISTAAALANWHARLTGADTSMRPGIDPAEHALAPTKGDVS